MKKITLVLALVATAFIGNAQNPFTSGYYSVNTVGTTGSPTAPAAVDVDYVVQVTPGPGDNEFTISDITGGFYPMGYTDGDDNPGVVTVNTADQTLTITDQPDVVYSPDTFNGSGTYTVASGDVSSFEYTWSNTYGDNATSTFTPYTGNTDAPEVVMNPTPADGATNVEVSGLDNNDDGEPDNTVIFSWDPATTGGEAVVYDLYISDDPQNFGSVVTRTEETTVPIANVPLSITLYWKVVAKNPFGDAESNVWSFTTADELTMGIENVVINNFNFYYSNANQSLEVSAANAIDNVTVYSILGQEVINSNFDASNASVNVSALNNGVYIAKITSEGKSKTVKFAKN